ncbi:MAG: signal peptidase II [Chloroflexota bacterium]
MGISSEPAEVTMSKENRTSLMPILIAVIIGLFLFIVDWSTKSWAVTNLIEGQRVPTNIPLLFWRLTFNTGSHYILGQVGQWIPYRLMMGIAATAVVVLMVYMARESLRVQTRALKWLHWAILALLIGSMGNAIEVITRGHATDFFMIDPFPWPSNLCDQYVNFTVFALFPLSLILGWRAERETMRGDNREDTS